MDLTRAARDPWVWGQLILLVFVGIGAPLIARINLGPLDPILGQADPWPIRQAGWLLLATGVAGMAWGVGSLGKNLTPGVEPLASGEFVTTGAYARVRHPIYSGLIAASAGYAWLCSNWRLGLLVGAGAGLYFGAKASAEEQRLLKRFKEYEAYRKQVPKLVPWGRPG